MISVILVIIFAFLAGMEGVLDEFQFHQPLVACTLIGLATGHLVPCIMLGGSLQMIALGWANIGAAVAPDIALASVASAIIFVQGGGQSKDVGTAIAIAIPLAVAGLFLTMVVRTISVAISHIMDREAEKGSIRGVNTWQLIALSLQGLRIAIPAIALMSIPSSIVRDFLNSMPAWLTDGMTIGGGMVVAVGYQHDRHPRSLAILHHWVRPRRRFPTDPDCHWGLRAGLNPTLPTIGKQGWR